MENADYLQRATELGLILNDQDAIESARVALVHWIVDLSKAKELRWCLELIDSILTIKKYLKNGELEICVGVAKEGTEFYRNIRDGYNLQRSFLEKLIDLMNAEKKPEEISKVHKSNS